jgi:TfoX/Sxy family transcriptional regulator of competence genes
MASTKKYKDYILEQLSLLDNISYRPMMGEYLLYYNKKLFGGIYDDRLLIKKTESNKKYNMQEAIPYDGAKAMYLVNDIDNQESLTNIVIDTYNDLN